MDKVMHNQTVAEEMADHANDITRKGLKFANLSPQERIKADKIMEDAATLKTQIDTFNKELQDE